MDAGRSGWKSREAATAQAETGASHPQLTNAERAFWRRAVELERARKRCGRPAPFPFQPA